MVVKLLILLVVHLYKYKPSEISHCTHRPVSQLISYTNCIIVLGILYLINDSITEVVENYSLFCIKLCVYNHAFTTSVIYIKSPNKYYAL